MSSEVFISYCHRDLRCATAVAEALHASSVSAFLDTDIRVGELWDRRLEQEIAGAGAVIVIWTSESARSQWVRKEARLALTLDKLCPAIAAPCEVPLEFSDIQAAPLIDWGAGDLSHSGWLRLIARVRHVLAGGRSQGVPVRGEVAFRLGKRFLEGKDCPRDLSLARQFLLDASRQGHRSASEMLHTLEVRPESRSTGTQPNNEP
ncbi:TIR domain-containing protein [Zoogloea sp.]|uniref:toll/interleukin-1 receptor domain-containing protein n=1 Tax=Zoogloea sp. TaxID=49181 RepID=UPI0035AEE872